MKTIEEKAKAYDEALEKAKKLYEEGTITESIGYIFPELTMSEDEKIRNSIIENLKGNMYRADGDYDLLNKQIAWLEKQQSVEEIVERCKDSWYNEGRIDGRFEGITDDVKYQQGWHDALEKQNEQNPAWSEEDEKKIKKVMHIVSLDGRISNEECKNIFDWLNSLKDRVQSQNHWEPSEEQMIALRQAISGCSYDIEPLVELETKLKEL